MKRNLFLFAFASLLFAACSGQSGEQSDEATTNEQTEETTVPVASSEPGKMDPVCEMGYDESWTEYSVYEGDTVWFCSETCKTAFEGNPQKYVKVTE